MEGEKGHLSKTFDPNNLFENGGGGGYINELFAQRIYPFLYRNLCTEFEEIR